MTASRPDRLPLAAAVVDHRRLTPELAARLPPAADRERFVRTGGAPAEGLMVLATCGRTEVYTADGSADALRARLARVLSLSPSWVTPLRGTAALRHLLRVGAGLESVALGEREVLGQLQRALRSSEERGTSGPILRHLTAGAIRAGRRVRVETQIAAASISLTGTAVRLAGDLDGRSVVILGSGRIAERLAVGLTGRAALTIVARNPATRERLARRCGADHTGWDQLRERVLGADVVFAATSAGAVLAPADLAGHPGDLVCVDLGVPANFAGGIARRGVRLVDFARVSRECEAAQLRRNAAVPEVERLVERELVAQLHWYAGHRAAQRRAQGGSAAGWAA